MAGILSRATRAAFNLSRVSQRSAVAVLPARFKGGMPDPMDHATGLERKELEAIARGNPDPFTMAVQKRGAGTKASPTLVPSQHDMRLIGCICDEDSFHINYMWLYKGEAKRCGECGHWYNIKEIEDPFKDIPDPHTA